MSDSNWNAVHILNEAHRSPGSVELNVESTAGKTLLLWSFSKTKPTEADFLHHRLYSETFKIGEDVGPHLREFCASSVLINGRSASAAWRMALIRQCGKAPVAFKSSTEMTMPAVGKTLISPQYFYRYKTLDMIPNYTFNIMANTYTNHWCAGVWSNPMLFLEGLTPVPAELSQCLTSNCFQLSRHRRLSPGTCTTSLSPQWEANNRFTATGCLCAELPQY